MHIPKLLVIFVIYASSIGYLCSCDARPASSPCVSVGDAKLSTRFERSKDPRVSERKKSKNLPKLFSEWPTTQ